jgi:small-conductance mechanosensitive channel
MREEALDLAARLIEFIPQAASALLIFLAFWVAGVVGKRLIARLTAQVDSQRRQVLHLLAQITKGALIIVGLIMALGTLGIDVSALVAGLGLTGFALGFAFRDALSNLLAGMLILIYRPFEVGDHVKVSSFEGRVLEIDLRYTTLQGDGQIYLVPNSMLFTNPITRFGEPSSGGPR